MLGNNRGRNFDVYEGGERVLSVRYLNVEEPVLCCICGQPTFSQLCVPFYKRAVRTGQSEGGYAPACDPCYRKWEVWDDGKSLAARRKPVHGGYPTPAPAPVPVGRDPFKPMPVGTKLYAQPPGVDDRYEQKLWLNELFTLIETWNSVRDGTPSKAEAWNALWKHAQNIGPGWRARAALGVRVPFNDQSKEN